MSEPVSIYNANSTGIKKCLKGSLPDAKGIATMGLLKVFT